MKSPPVSLLAPGRARALALGLSGLLVISVACSSSGEVTEGEGSGPGGGAPSPDSPPGVTPPPTLPPASPTDGIKNNGETDVDCGGPSAPTCADGKACAAPTDCASGVCAGSVCAAPSPTDQVKNGSETDIDCGGPDAKTPRCASGKVCAQHTDCASEACPAGTCSEARSCRFKAGGATCGPGEVGDAGAKHEDCCVSATVQRPAASGGPFKMDKYLITAGRMRAFLEAVNYDARGWIAAHRPAWWTGSGTSGWDAMLPRTLDEFISMSATGGSGCWVGTNAASGRGAPAYWAPAADLSRVVGGGPRAYSKDELDTKVMNCFRAPLFHALCAYDGGRMPSRAEWIAARTVGGATRPYPWDPLVAGGSDAERRARGSYDFDYSWPREPVAADADLGGYLPAPGRFPLGNGPYGHADLLGAVENMGSQPASGAGVTGDGWFQFSFQEKEQPTHPYGQQIASFGSGAYRNHWAVGGRCVKLP